MEVLARTPEQFPEPIPVPKTSRERASKHWSMPLDTTDADCGGEIAEGSANLYVVPDLPYDSEKSRLEQELEPVPDPESETDPKTKGLKAAIILGMGAIAATVLYKRKSVIHDGTPKAVKAKKGKGASFFNMLCGEHANKTRGECCMTSCESWRELD